MKKIAEIITRLNIGGPSFHTLALTRALKDMGWDAFIITGCSGKFEGSLLEKSSVYGIRIEVIRELSSNVNLLKDMIAFFRLLILLVRERPDILHSHTAKAGFMARLTGIILKYLLRRRVTVIHTYHGFIFEHYFSKPVSWAILALERLLARMTDKIICVSEQLRAAAVRRYFFNSDSSIITVPYGVKISRFSSVKPPEQLKIKLGINKDAFVLACVGRIVPIKDHGLFLESACQFVKGFKVDQRRIQFLIVGDGPERARMEKKSEKLGIQDMVIFAGWQDDMASVYSIIDVLCITSKNEGLPIVALEAMAGSKPVLATDVGGVRDIFTPSEHRRGYLICNEGILIEERDPHLLSEVMNLVFENRELLSRMGISARKRAEEMFSEEKMFMATDHLFREVVRAQN